MADKVTYAISCTPQEELTDENSGTRYVLASEVGKSLGGSGVATAASYGGTADNQGYLNQIESLKCTKKKMYLLKTQDTHIVVLQH